ncbi:MAG: hypothetical protein H7Y12_13350 [Sphingobacteriaceae bacterium]|nr:hypothetical protein [Cytophagaceae bacterium]
MNVPLRWLIGIWWGLGCCSTAFAQDSARYHLSAFASAGTLPAVGGRTPFWLAANQFGIIPNTPQAGLLQVGLRYRQALGRPNRWGIEAALEGVVQSNNPGVNLIVPEAFARLHYRKWELMVGRRREILGFQDSTLSSGGALWSGNALPLPQVRIGNSDYVPFPVLKRWLSFKGFFTHGWFEGPKANAFVQNGYLHSKGLYLRFGKDTWPVAFHAGLVHYAQWGGYAPELKDDNGSYSKFGYFEASWLAYWRVIRAKSLNPVFYGGTSPAEISLDINRVGNHIGTLDLATEIRFKTGRLFLYRQHFIEDGSLFFLTNVADGLNGIRWQRSNQPQTDVSLDRLTAEYLYTISQGGSVFDVNIGKLRGRDNYFDQSQYRDGWAYQHRTIGTPFITPDADLAKGVRKDIRILSNNRVRMFHIGAAGRAFGVGWETKWSFSQNFGTYEYPMTPSGAGVNQLSGLIRGRSTLPFGEGLEASFALGWDKGGLYDDALGLYLGVRKTWGSLLKPVENRQTSPRKF